MRYTRVVPEASDQSTGARNGAKLTVSSVSPCGSEYHSAASAPGRPDQSPRRYQGKHSPINAVDPDLRRKLWDGPGACVQNICSEACPVSRYSNRHVSEAELHHWKPMSRL